MDKCLCIDPKLVYTNEDTVCGNCGVVVDTSYAEQPNAKSNAILGTESNYNKMLSNIVTGNKRTYTNITIEISDICKRLGLSTTLHEQSRHKALYVARHNRLSGHKVRHLCAACVYLICRLNNVPIPITLIATSTGINKKSLSREYKWICDKLDVNVIVPPKSFLSNILKRLNITNGTLLQESTNLLDKITLIGKTPIVLASAAIFVVLSKRKDNDICLADISRASNVSSIAIKNVATEILQSTT